MSLVSASPPAPALAVPALQAIVLAQQIFNAALMALAAFLEYLVFASLQAHAQARKLQAIALAPQTFNVAPRAAAVEAVAAVVRPVLMQLLLV